MVKTSDNSPTTTLPAASVSPITTGFDVQSVWTGLKTVIDPELYIDIVSLGLIYDVKATQVIGPDGPQPHVHILLTLTTPGCPLAATFDTLIRDSLRGIPDLDADEQISIELTFDPPWVPDMMSAEAKAELGFD